MSKKTAGGNGDAAMLPLERLGKWRRAVNLLFTHELKPLGLGPKQGIIMKYLAKQGKSTLTELAALTISDPAAVGRSLGCLSRKGFIVQRFDEADHRRRVIALNKKGQTMAKEVIKVFNGIAVQVTSTLSASEKRAFIVIIDKMILSIPHTGDIPAVCGTKKGRLNG